MLQVTEYALDQIDLNDTSCHNWYDLKWSNLTYLIRDNLSTVLDPVEEVSVTETVEVDIFEDTIFNTITDVILYQ